MWNLVSIRLEIVLIMTQDRCTFWTHPMVLLGDEAEVEAHFDPFADSANLDADRCMVCGERTLGSEIILDVPNGT